MQGTLFFLILLRIIYATSYDDTPCEQFTEKYDTRILNTINNIKMVIFTMEKYNSIYNAFKLVLSLKTEYISPYFLLYTINHIRNKLEKIIPSEIEPITMFSDDIFSLLKHCSLMFGSHPGLKWIFHLEFNLLLTVCDDITTLQKSYSGTSVYTSAITGMKLHLLTVCNSLFKKLSDTLSLSNFFEYNNVVTYDLCPQTLKNNLFISFKDMDLYVSILVLILQDLKNQFDEFRNSYPTVVREFSKSELVIEIVSHLADLNIVMNHLNGRLHGSINHSETGITIWGECELASKTCAKIIFELFSLDLPIFKTKQTIYLHFKAILSMINYHSNQIDQFLIQRISFIHDQVLNSIFLDIMYANEQLPTTLCNFFIYLHDNINEIYSFIIESGANL